MWEKTSGWALGKEEKAWGVRKCNEPRPLEFVLISIETLVPGRG